MTLRPVAFPDHTQVYTRHDGDVVTGGEGEHPAICLKKTHAHTWLNKQGCANASPSVALRVLTVLLCYFFQLFIFCRILLILIFRYSCFCGLCRWGRSEWRRPQTPLAHHPFRASHQPASAYLAGPAEPTSDFRLALWVDGVGENLQLAGADTFTAAAIHLPQRTCRNKHIKQTGRNTECTHQTLKLPQPNLPIDGEEEKE